MGRSAIGLCGAFGSLVGAYAPALWGASGFSPASLLFALVGGIAGIWLGAKLSDAL